MKTTKTSIITLLLLTLLLSFFLLCACNNTSDISFEEPPATYEFTTKQTYMWEPGFLTLSISSTQMVNVLYCNNESMQFFINNDNENQANSIVYNELRLINYLKYLFQNENIPFPNKIYVDDSSSCVSGSAASKLLLNFNSIGKYSQVLATLQVIYGDYFNYGYLYGLSNYIANELGWETDVIETIENDKLVDFFSSNVNALDLTYPVFTEKYSSNESVKYCKALSTLLFNRINNNNLLKESISDQETAFYNAINQFAIQNSISHDITTFEFAFYGDTCPLKIKTQYLEIFMSDGHFIDSQNDIFQVADLVGYNNIVNTIKTLENEVDFLLYMFSLKDIADVATVYLYSTEACQEIHFKEYLNFCYPAARQLHVTCINAFLHEYGHYVEYLLNPESPGNKRWQSQAFAELCGSYSYYRQRQFYNSYSNPGVANELVKAYYGKELGFGREDTFDYHDAVTHALNDYELIYMSGDRVSSFGRYLCDIYGEAKIMRLMLFPDTVQEITGKDWETLRSEWELYLKEKFSNVDYILVQ